MTVPKMLHISKIHLLTLRGREYKPCAEIILAAAAVVEELHGTSMDVLSLQGYFFSSMSLFCFLFYGECKR